MNDDPRFMVELVVRTGPATVVHLEDFEGLEVGPGEHPVEAVRQALLAYDSMADLVTQEGLTEDLVVVVQVYDSEGEAVEFTIDSDALLAAWTGRREQQMRQYERERQSRVRDVDIRGEVL